MGKNLTLLVMKVDPLQVIVVEKMVMIYVPSGPLLVSRTGAVG